METKTIGMITTAVIAIAVVGSITTLGQKDIPSEHTPDKYAVDSQTLTIQLENDKPVLVVDVRSESQFQNGHISGASHDNYLDSAVLEKRVNTIQKRLPEIVSSYEIILVDQDGTLTKQTAQTMSDMGIKTRYLDGGMNNWNQDLVSSSQTTINTKELFQKIKANDDIYLLDVREPDELLQSKIEGAENIPLAQIFEPNGMDVIPTDKPVIVICGSGNRATIATYALAQENIDFQVLEGGMNAWNSSFG